MSEGELQLSVHSVIVDSVIFLLKLQPCVQKGCAASFYQNSQLELCLVTVHLHSC